MRERPRILSTMYTRDHTFGSGGGCRLDVTVISPSVCFESNRRNLTATPDTAVLLLFNFIATFLIDTLTAQTKLKAASKAHISRKRSTLSALSRDGIDRSFKCRNNSLHTWTASPLPLGALTPSWGPPKFPSIRNQSRRRLQELPRLYYYFGAATDFSLN